MYTDYESACAADVSLAQALSEIRRHCASIIEFYAEVGCKPSYRGAEILHWLGY